ncbi:protein-L-isoaspartate(D-aspartate) O-methyltransferase [Pseudidiomarina sp. 1APR75-33.1]|uniref:protein-L-isoaspartate(D-aspartate) O-methyltransferase n=1 Tax=Pseudidiomarina terrestris TaxID=2820060 RepID=UPI0026570875|nr:protein-L-isoaspartate(D-aspartate) O-methyltransferase [Pseudidiomarina sp. 1APR75-33.1]MDN7126903.1 protein-L-isoaspartate(D-aspartate) O-methyltransferase [Pseudidiomarina sp. 1APR75-33.1]
MDSKERMIERHLKGRDIHDERVLDAMRAVDRSLFVPEDLQHHTYADSPLPIGKEQTISQPYIVAYMVQALGLSEDDRVLEIGTGCGYNAAVLGQLADEVYSIEIIKWLADLAQKNLAKIDSDNISARFGDGYDGWPEEAPFDAIELTAAPSKIPETLKQQLKIGGKLLAPVGRLQQQLQLIERVSEDEFTEQLLMPVRFVPMTGQAESSS